MALEYRKVLQICPPGSHYWHDLPSKISEGHAWDASDFLGSVSLTSSSGIAATVIAGWRNNSAPAACRRSTGSNRVTQGQNDLSSFKPSTGGCTADGAFGLSLANRAATGHAHCFFDPLKDVASRFRAGLWHANELLAAKGRWNLIQIVPHSP
jgi:hypothetical protein